MKRIPLHWQIVIALGLGTIYAVIAVSLGLDHFTENWISPFGDIFIRLLKLIAVPLVLFSIINGISGLSDIKKIGRIGVKTLAIYMATTVFAVGMGMLIVNIAGPGRLIDKETRLSNRIKYEKWVAETPGARIKDGQKYWDGSNSDLIEDTPDAALAAKIKAAESEKGKGPLNFLVEMVPDNIFVSLNDNRLMLQVIFFAIFFGIVLIIVDPKKAQPVISFVEGSNEVFLKMVDVVMQGAPIFVFALMAGQITKLAGGSLSKMMGVFEALSWYSLTVVFGLALMIFAFYPLLIKLGSKKMTYKKFFKGIGPAQLLAFSSSSSAATLPVTMECVNNNLKVDKEISSFVLPIGATVNMDGTSMYQAIAVVFLAQFHMVELTLDQQLIIILTATLASIGAAAVPSAGLIMLIIVLESVGLNPAWIAIIFPVDRILDMCRTVVNVTGDATVSTIIASTEGALGDIEDDLEPDQTFEI